MRTSSVSRVLPWKPECDVDTSKEKQATYDALMAAGKAIESAVKPLGDYLNIRSLHNIEERQRIALSQAASLIQQVAQWVEWQPGDDEGGG